jgi:hypothetical protein
MSINFDLWMPKGNMVGNYMMFMVTTLCSIIECHLLKLQWVNMKVRVLITLCEGNNENRNVLKGVVALETKDLNENHIC